MSIKYALLLSLLQGITEFLPISSSGHLVYAQHMLGLQDLPLLFDLILHLGTAVAAGIFFHRTIGCMLRDSFVYLVNSGQRKSIISRGNTRLLLYILLSVAVTGAFGMVFRDTIAQFFSKPRWVPLFFAVTGVLLLTTKFIPIKNKDISDITWIQPVVIGAVQAGAGFPGISRAGATVSAGLFMGMSRRFSGTYSFILAIPSIIGASLFEFLREGEALQRVAVDPASTSFMAVCAVGFVVSTVAGYGALKLLIPILYRGRWFIFSYYCFGIALAGFLLAALRVTS